MGENASGPALDGVARLFSAMNDIVARRATAQDRLDALTALIAAHAEAGVCSIYLRRADDSLELFSTVGLNADAVHTTRLGWGEGLVGLVAETQQALATADAPYHPNFSYRPETGEDPFRSFFGVPLLRSHKTLGVLVLQNQDERQFTDEQKAAAHGVASLLAEIAASGELLDARSTAEVGEMLHRPERIEGVGVSPGVAIGRIAFKDPPTPKHKVFASDVAFELARLDAGVARLKASVAAMVDASGFGGATQEVLETYRLFANDRGWIERLRNAVVSGLTAESAVEQVQIENRKRMARIADPYIRERLHDLDDLARRLLRLIAGEASPASIALPEDAIVAARILGPAELLEYDRTRMRGLVVSEASATSHVAIVARTLGYPLVAGAEAALGLAEEGDLAIVDGDAGEVHLRPTPEIVASYREKQSLQSEQQAAYAAEKALATETRDGVPISLMMNAGLPIDLEHLEKTGAAGIGLFRTELQFLIGAQLPRVAAQEALYAEILRRADDRPVVFRTADLGGDKSAAYMKRRAEANPAMGWRGMRLAVDRPGLLRTQLRALLGAAAGRRLQVLFPMVTIGREIDAARLQLDREIALRHRRGKPLPASIAVGAMIETPAAAWRLDDILRRVDFVSIGGNDLAQFYFAADRESEGTQRRYDPLDSGFLSFIQRIVVGARAAGKPLSFCGEQAADPLMAAALIGVGVESLSIPASSVGPFRRLVRSIRREDLATWLAGQLAAEPFNLRRDFAARLRKLGAALP